MAVAMARPAAMWSLDISYEFSAPHFFDFTCPESEAQIRSVEAWFEMAAGYDPSPYNEPGLGEFLGLCGNAEKVQLNDLEDDKQLKLLVRLDHHSADDKNANCSLVELCAAMSEVDLSTPCTLPRSSSGNSKYIEEAPPECLIGALPAKRLHSQALGENETDKLQQRTATKKSTKTLKRHAGTNTKRKQLAKSALKPVQAPEVRPFKRQKLDVESQAQAIKSTPALTVPRAFQLSTDQRAQRRGVYGTVSKMSDLCSSFVSLAEQVQRFYFKTPERFHKKDVNDRKFAMGLTKPKTPDLETSHRSRPPRVKSTAELEEELLAKLPRFRARPANKKILEAPTLPAPPRTIPQLPHFQEFNLKTTERALQHMAHKDSHMSATEKKKQRRKSAPGGDPRHLLMRIRPSRPVKTTEELQLEELAKVPKFKARPFNKKIFDNRGGLPGSRTQKRQVTEPVEFKFATAERCQHEEGSLKDSFRRLSLDSHPRNRPELGKTKAVPFHLLTEDRGSSKMARFFEEVSKQMLNESIARIPKANLLPLTTDFPEVPPKPAMKPCTRPEPFQLESLLRHEQELQRVAEERAKAEQEEAEARRFRAQPVQRWDVFVPERSRKPLTEIKEFEFQAENRAAQRAEFEKKMLEKQNQYKKFKEELEALRKEEEEKFVKALRKEMVPQARPMPLFDKTFVPQRSSKALTMPVSPQLNTARSRRAEGPFAPSRKFRMR